MRPQLYVPSNLKPQPVTVHLKDVCFEEAWCAILVSAFPNGGIAPRNKPDWLVPIEALRRRRALRSLSASWRNTAGKPIAHRVSPKFLKAIQSGDLKVPQMSFDNNVTLQEMLDFFQAAWEVKIVADWNRLESAGVEKKAPLCVLLPRELSFPENLEHVLAAVPRDMPEVGYYLEGNTIHVTTFDIACQKTFVDPSKR